MSTEARGSGLLTYAEAALELRCSAATVAREVAEGRLAFRALRRRRFIHRDDLEAYLRASRRLERPEAPEHFPSSTASLRAMGWSGKDHGSKKRPKTSSARAAGPPRSGA